MVAHFEDIEGQFVAARVDIRTEHIDSGIEEGGGDPLQQALPIPPADKNLGMTRLGMVDPLDRRIEVRAVLIDTLFKESSE